MAEVGFGALKLIVDLIREEALLLGRLQDDVRFITDELEGMSNQLRHLVETRDVVGNYQVRSWTKQVMEFALETKECVHQYAKPKANGRLLDHLPVRPATISDVLVTVLNYNRAGLAARIQKLKLRASEIAERQKRYADSVPPMREDGSGVANNQPVAIGQSGRHYQNHQQKAHVNQAVLCPEPDMMLTESKTDLIKWIKVEPAASNNGDAIRVVAIVAPDEADGATLGKEVFKHFSAGDDGLTFERKLRITVKRPPSLFEILLGMLNRLHREDEIVASSELEKWGDKKLEDKLQNLHETWDDEKLKVKLKDKYQDLETWNNEQLKAKLRDFLSGKRFLLVISDIDYTEIWVQVKGALDSLNCSAGSIVLFSTKHTEVATRSCCSSTSRPNTLASRVGFYLKKALSAKNAVVASSSCSPTKTIFYSHVDFYLKKAASLVSHEYSDVWRLQRIKEILQKCDPDINCMNMFLRALYCNPNKTEQELQRLSESLGPRCAKEDRMIAFCYEGLPKDYKICLWYSIVCTPRRDHVRRASLVRRWVAEDLISKSDQFSALDEAERCFDMLITQNLLSPELRGGTNKIKSYEVPDLVIGMIGEEIPTLEDLVLTNQLQLEPFEKLFSLRSLCKLHQANNLLSPKKDLGQGMKTRQKESMAQFLKFVETSPSSQHMRVLDLEDYTDIKKRHLKIICKIHKLRYLSLRNTDVMELPSEMEKLQCLETLDIRQTRVRKLNTFLPKLKHLLAGHTDCTKQDIVKSTESFSTTRIPRDVADMTFLEILSHVEVSDSAKELIFVGEKLQKLRKLGVVLRGNKTSLKDLFLQIKKLHNCLRSLSIRMERPEGTWEAIDLSELTLPELQSLNICGIRGPLPHQVKGLHQLAKITLRDTGLKVDALDILGALKGLSCLRLHYHSFAEDALTFLDRQFSCLIDLVIEDDILKSVTFAPGTAPNLKKILWIFSDMKSLSGVGNLPRLTDLNLNGGKCDQGGLTELRKDIAGGVKFKLNTPENSQGSEQAGAAP
ncbi:unnamed protein product [Urochloa humidicola]